MSKVDWITWKTDVTDIITPEKVIDSVTDSYNEFNSYMNPVIYENIKYEIINGGLDKSSINILGHSPANKKYYRKLKITNRKCNGRRKKNRKRSVSKCIRHKNRRRKTNIKRTDK